LIKLVTITNVKVSLDKLKEEVNQIRKTHPKLKDDAAFVLWFLRAFLADSEDQALKALTGATGDKSIDAILIDERSRQVHLVQGKFRQSDHTEKRSDVLAFADLSNYPWEDKGFLRAFYSKLDPLVREKFEELLKRVHLDKYGLRLYYVTTGRCSKTIVDEAKARVQQAKGPVEFFVYDFRDVLTILKDYLEGVAPAVPTLFLPLASEGPTQDDGAVHRYDPRKRIESWVFTMSANDVGDMYAKAGIRLFARNIRGFLGITSDINKAMAQTASEEPDNFWYYNNGVTIVCDDVKREQYEGKDVMRVTRPQVINGQQTTRVLHEKSPTKGSVLVRIIKIPRHPGDDEEYDSLVNSIVRATNWQNSIRPSDLVSNDYIQVYIERSLRKLGYQYIRKRMTKSEAKRLLGGEPIFQIDKLEMAQAVAACEFDPVTVRKGKEGLFEDPWYKSIFGSREMSYYLSRYWLMRRVQNIARGKPERAYAKWLVLKFAWQLVSRYIETGQGAAKFRYICENDHYNILVPLNLALDKIFKAVRIFFMLQRGKGEEAKDISTFFLLTKLDLRFREFWKSSKNPHREKVEVHIEKFRKALEKFEISE